MSCFFYTLAARCSPSQPGSGSACPKPSPCWMHWWRWRCLVPTPLVSTEPLPRTGFGPHWFVRDCDGCGHQVCVLLCGSLSGQVQASAAAESRTPRLVGVNPIHLLPGGRPWLRLCLPSGDCPGHGVCHPESDPPTGASYAPHHARWLHHHLHIRHRHLNRHHSHGSTWIEPRGTCLLFFKRNSSRESLALVGAHARLTSASLESTLCGRPRYVCSLR